MIPLQFDAKNTLLEQFVAKRYHVKCSFFGPCSWVRFKTISRLGEAWLSPMLQANSMLLLSRRLCWRHGKKNMPFKHQSILAPTGHRSSSLKARLLQTENQAFTTSSLVHTRTSSADGRQWKGSKSSEREGGTPMDCLSRSKCRREWISCQTRRSKPMEWVTSIKHAVNRFGPMSRHGEK